MGKGAIAAVAPCFATQLLSVFMPKVMSARKVLEKILSCNSYTVFVLV